MRNTAGLVHSTAALVRGIVAGSAQDPALVLRV